MKKSVQRFARLVVLMAIVAAVLVPTAALAADISIQPQSATLVAKGAAVDVSVTFTCPAGSTVSNPWSMPGAMSVSLQQAVTKTEQATGYSYSGGQLCTGQPQTAVISVLATVPGPPFRNGSAVASAFIEACDANLNCVWTSTGLVTVRIGH